MKGASAPCRDMEETGNTESMGETNTFVGETGKNESRGEKKVVTSKQETASGEKYARIEALDVTQEETDNIIGKEKEKREYYNKKLKE